MNDVIFMSTITSNNYLRGQGKYTFTENNYNFKGLQG